MTKPCVFFAKKICLKGALCQFSHDQDALAKLPLCDFYKHEPQRCRFGDNCRRIHGDWCTHCKMYTLHPWNLEQRQRAQSLNTLV